MSRIQNININRVEVKLADTDDPLASSIGWDPVNSGGANFKTQVLEKVSPQLLRIKPTLGARIFSLVFILPGLGGLVIGVPYQLFQGMIWEALFFVVWGGLFAGAGFVMWHQFSKGYVFDRKSGYYFQGKQKKPGRQSRSAGGVSSEKQGRLADIHALQILTERVSSHSSKGGSSSYHSYEINLVLGSGKRVNIMDHGKESAIEDNARELAGFLDVPVWRASYGS
ncbi:MAG: hypothetical protein OEZ23_06330 [Gammaproteobacteria bacterium]|nr:hypothetical protein [Gammaproteobacteria bacterium]